MIAQTNKVVVLGSGPGGASAAMRLARLGIECMVIDKANFPRDKICGDALSGKVLEALKKLDKNLPTAFRTAEGQIGAWGIRFVAPNGNALDIPFKLNYNTQDTPPGHLCTRWVFDDWLHTQLKGYAPIEIRTGLGVKKLTEDPTGIHITFEDASQLHTPLLIAADGAQSIAAAQLAGYKMEAQHFSAGIRAYYQGVKDLLQDNFIELHFLSALAPGYFWIFPLPNGLANVGLGIRSDYIRKRKLNLKNLLQQIIQEHPAFKHRFQNATLRGAIKGFGLPLGSKPRLMSGKRYLLVGDAAALIDPFTGEGIGNAMLSGIFAANTAAAFLQAEIQDLSPYDQAVRQRLGTELQIGKSLQRLSRSQTLFNIVVNRAKKNPALQELISCMFEDINLRAKFKDPRFYLRFLGF